MILLIESLVFIMTVALIIHASQTYTTRFVLMFWGSGVILGILREIAVVQYIGLYAYGEFNITALGFPLIYLSIWTNFAYISWQWANNFLETEYLKARAWDHHMPFIFLTSVLIAFFLEALFSMYGLIIWNIDSSRLLWGSTPLLAPFAYGFTSIVFMSGVKVLSRETPQNWSVLSLKLILAQPITLLIILGLLLLTNLLIILIFS